MECGKRSRIRKSTAFFVTSVPEIIDPVFAKSSQNARFLLSENERFGLVFVKTGSINSGTGLWSADEACILYCSYVYSLITHGRKLHCSLVQSRMPAD
jgi:hypothetical protein